MHAEFHRYPSLWVLVGEAEVRATQAPSLLHNGPDCMLYVRTTLALHGLEVANFPIPERVGLRGIGLRARPDLFRETLEQWRTCFYRELVDRMACLDRFGARAPASRQTRPESVRDFALRMLASGEALLQNLERDRGNPSPNEPDAGLPALRDAVGELARLLSERLARDSAFYDAIAQSVSIPTWAQIERRASTRDDEFWLMPVNLA